MPNTPTPQDGERCAVCKGQGFVYTVLPAPNHIETCYHCSGTGRTDTRSQVEERMGEEDDLAAINTALIHGQAVTMPERDAAMKALPRVATALLTSQQREKRLEAEIERLRADRDRWRGSYLSCDERLGKKMDALDEIAGVGTDVAAGDDAGGFYRSQLHRCIGIAARANARPSSLDTGE